MTFIIILLSKLNMFIIPFLKALMQREGKTNSYLSLIENPKEYAV